MCRVPEAGPRFALTFDDGPSSRNTARLLDVLARHGARSTFFLIARRIRRHAGLVRRIIDAGHEVGLHGDVHLPAWAQPGALLVRDLDYAMRVAVEVTGRRPRRYRAPFGLLLPAQASWVRAMGLEPVLGSVYPRDHAVRRPEVIARRVLDRLEPGAIVILHDSSALGDHDRGPTIAAVEMILDAARERGMQAVTVEELEAAAAAQR